MMGRFIGWEDRLIDYVEKFKQKKFRYGRFDCVVFALGAVKAQTGVDILKDLPMWKSKKTADETILSMGGCLVEAAKQVLPKFGMREESNVLMAQRGDLVIVDVESVQALGLCIGAKVAVPGPEKLTYLPLAGITCWKLEK